VRDEEIAEHADPAAVPESAVEALIDLANARGGEDNITVVLLRWENGAA
jgi:serine/threonine protein phosphatase PrpC